MLSISFILKKKLIRLQSEQKVVLGCSKSELRFPWRGVWLMFPVFMDLLALDELNLEKVHELYTFDWCNFLYV